MIAILFALATGCALNAYNGTNGGFHSAGAFGAAGTVAMAEEANRRAAMVRCDQILAALRAGQLQQYDVVQCGDPYGGVYAGPITGLWPLYPQYGYGLTPAQAYSVAYTDAVWRANQLDQQAQTQQALEAAAEVERIRRLALEPADGQ